MKAFESISAPQSGAPAGDWRPGLPAAMDLSRPALRRLKAVVLLAGALRRTPFVAGIGRPVADLPWDGGRTVLDVWREHTHRLALAIGWDRPLIQLLVDQKSPAMRPETHVGTARGVEVAVRRDPSELRGSGGVLFDLAAEYADDDHLLVCHAAQVLREPLTRFAAAAAARDSDVGLIAHDDGSPISIWTLRCGCIRSFPAVGFVDFMEQGLPRIAGSHRVHVTFRRRSSGWPLRTHGDYIRALRAHHQRVRQLAVAADTRVVADADADADGMLALTAADEPFAEDCKPLFRLAEAGARIDPKAGVFDSVVLDGARVEAGATVVRSVLCPGAVVRRGQHAVDALVNNAPSRSAARVLLTPAVPAVPAAPPQRSAGTRGEAEEPGDVALAH